MYFSLRLIVIATIIRCAFIGQYENCFIGVLALILFLIPPFIEHQFKVELPTTLEVIAFSFVFCAQILGEIGCYYIKYPFWDSMLHTVNGFVFAAFGFCLMDMFNKSKRTSFSLSPFSLALVAFCFSMTIGVLWEFVEFGIDYFLDFDMQKDFIIRNIHTVALKIRMIFYVNLNNQISRRTAISSVASLTAKRYSLSVIYTGGDINGKRFIYLNVSL